MTVTASRIGSVPGPQSSMWSSNGYTPSGIARMASRTFASVRSMISAIAAWTVSWPYRRASSTIRSSPTRSEFRWARRSPSIDSAVRVFASTMARMSSCSSPPFHGLIGGTCRPSWK